MDLPLHLYKYKCKTRIEDSSMFCVMLISEIVCEAPYSSGFSWCERFESCLTRVILLLLAINLLALVFAYWYRLINEFNNRCEAKLVPFPVFGMSSSADIFLCRELEYENRSNSR